METTYNGYKNRTTWLVALHLNNTSPEVLERAKTIVKNNDNITNGLLGLLAMETNFINEKNQDTAEIDWNEVAEALTE